MDDFLLNEEGGELMGDEIEEEIEEEPKYGIQQKPIQQRQLSKFKVKDKYEFFKTDYPIRKKGGGAQNKPGIYSKP